VINRIWVRHRRLIFIGILFLAPLVPLLLLKVSLPRIYIYDSLASWIVHPMAEAGRNLSQGVSTLWDRYVWLVGTSRDNDVLKKQVQQLNETIAGLDEVRLENERLQAVLQMPLLPQYERVLARIIGYDSTGSALSYVLNVGTNQGLSLRAPVVTPDGVVGTITKVFASSSIVVAMADPSHDLDGVITRTRARFIIEGRGQVLTGRLKYLDRAEDVRVGDSVVTSGMDGVFPKGLRVGTVVRVDRPKSGVLQNAELRMAADLGRIEEVLVLKQAQQ
jgi:rod shape-determining protein MreC